MNSTVQALIETVLTMYDSLSNRTLQLVKELTTRQKLEAKLLLAGSVFDNTLEAICIVDAAGNIVDANPAFCQSCGQQRDALLGTALAALKSSLGDDEHAPVVWSTVNDTGHWSGTVQCRAPSGELSAEWLTLSAIRDSGGTVGHYVAVFSSVGGLIQRQQAMEHWAHHDALTGLPNRLLLKDRLEQALAQARRDDKQLAVCYVDLDDFKPVNDRFGHAAGDHVLQITAERIRNELRGTDTVARVGGDEFVILFNGLPHASDKLACLDRIIAIIRQPIPLTADANGPRRPHLRHHRRQPLPRRRPHRRRPAATRRRSLVPRQIGGERQLQDVCAGRTGRIAGPKDLPGTMDLLWGRIHSPVALRSCSAGE